MSSRSALVWAQLLGALFYACGGSPAWSTAIGRLGAALFLTSSLGLYLARLVNL
jgi:hypothetical protein